MAAWFHDVRYAARALRANPGFTLATVLTMCLGIGATTGVFSVVDAVVLRPLPFPDAGRIVAVSTVRNDAPSRMLGLSLEDLRDWRAEARTLTALCGWRDWGMERSDTAIREGVYGIIATPELFQVFPAQPVLGRLFTADDDQPGHNRVLLLSYPYWRERFASRQDVVGMTMTLERGPRATYTIVGVLPPQFTEIPSFDGAQVFAPSSIDPDAATGRGHRNREVFARLAPGATLADAASEARVIATRLARQYPETNRDLDARVVGAVESEVGPVGDTLRALFAAVTLVLLIACGNVAGLQLVRALARRREFSIRQALGAGRLTIVRATLAESILVSLLGAAAGVLVAQWLVELVLTAGPPIPRASALRFDAGVFGFALAVCVAAGCLAALPAALLATRLNLATALREEAGSIARAVRARMVFVAGQITLALVLLTGAVVAAQTLAAQLRLDPGFDPSGVATIRMSVPLEHKGPEVAALYARAVQEARSVPGVLGASAVSAPPLSGEGAEPAPLAVDGDAPGASRHSANTFNVAPGYFATLGAPLRLGRDFGPEDTAQSPPVAVVNETFARLYLGGRDPIAAAVRLPGDDTPIRVVGVVADVRQVLRPRGAAEPEIYWPYSQRPRWATFLVLRADRPGLAVAAVKSRIQALDPALRVGSSSRMSDRIARSARGPRFITLLFGLFAAVALALSAIGVAGLVHYSFAQRMKEIAVRVSLGATRQHVLTLVAGSAWRAVLAGSVAGLAGALAVSRVLGSMLREMDPITPAALAVAWAVLVGVGALACYVPARRALRLNPADALRLD